MLIEATRDFKIPRARVWANANDPARLEAVMRDAGAQVTRSAEPPMPEWQGSKIWKGEPRAFTARLRHITPHETLAFDLAGALADVMIELNFYDLPGDECRVIGKATINAKTMGARVALQSLHLVRGRAQERVGRFIRVMGKA